MKNILDQHVLWNMLVFSLLGCFSLYFLSRYGGVAENKLDRVLNVKGYLTVIMLFNGVGMSLIYVNRHIRTASTVLLMRHRLIWFFVTVAFSLLILNYCLLTGAKWILGSHNPFGLAWSGIRSLLITWLIELVIVSQLLVTNFYRHLLLVQKRVAELEKNAVKTRYAALQKQLNPHFLFNSLNTLISEIAYNPDNAILFTRHMSDVYRYVLQCQDKQMTTLKAELDFLKSYVFLHKVRLGDCVHIDQQVPDECLEMELPPLTLQLLAENIIKHNVISLSKPMVIHVYVEEHCLCVSNSKCLKKCVEPSGKGLENLSQRYQLLSDRSVRIINDPDLFTVKVPLFDE